ncbi:MAG: serine/threonine-protein kinase, partial [Acidobacteriota bacterium]
MVRNSSKDAPEDNNPKTEWSRLDPLLDQVLAVDDAEQQRAIALKITEGDPDLRAELLQLVEGIGASEGFLTREPAAVWPDLIADLDGGAAPLPTGPDRAGEQLGVYRLEEQIGRGGMGEVYLAHRTDGAFERRVAVKIARPQPGLATPVERFRAEQHILADLDHPHIAGLLDAGLTDDGSPFAVMEYVKGRPIDEHCRGLSIDERLRLFVDVCEAVDHAHRRLVIHRDLKPSNILVDGDGRVKLLDFGIAKLLDPQGGASHDAGTLYLTPEYAAPEQFMRGR